MDKVATGHDAAAESRERPGKKELDDATGWLRGELHRASLANQLPKAASSCDD